MCGKDPMCVETHKSEEAHNEEETAGDEPGEKVEEIPEVQDPQEILREKCRLHCQIHVEELDKCNQRVLSKSQTKEICFEELIDLVHCVEHCVTPDLFKRLK